jgi:hypothetical protein
MLQSYPSLPSMKRTIASSFLFLYPLGIAHTRHDTPVVYASAIALAISVMNHSHVYHPDTVRRAVCGAIDACYMAGLPLYLLSRCITHTPTRTCYLHVFLYLSIVVTWYMGFLTGRRYTIRAIEGYSALQKWGHVGFHFIGILGGSELYRQYGVAPLPYNASLRSIK